MYPLKFQPIAKEKLWGGSKLRDVLGKEFKGESIGESWELSGVEGNVSIVANGNMAGASLQDIIKQNPNGLLGESVIKRFGTDFPILIKFIDAKKDLSVQLHPDDVLAHKRHNSFGKTEMWYVMDADKEAKLIIGFNKEVTKEEYKKSVKNDTLLELLNYETVHAGDTFFISPGKIHAIGAGVLLAEIQQTSDVTYRVFDFNRKDKDGNYRELHTELAIDAIDFKQKKDFEVIYSSESNAATELVACPYFTTQLLHLTENMTIETSQRDSFTILVCVDGRAVVENEYGVAEIQKGETLLLPALTNQIQIQSQGAKFLEVTV